MIFQGAYKVFKNFLFNVVCFAVLSLPMAHADESYDVALTNWSAVLNKFVDNEGRVDFEKLAQDREQLDKFVSYIASTSPASDPARFAGRDAVIAYHLNAYNALAMHGVIEKGIPSGFNSFFKRAAFFKFRKVIIGGEKTSLYDYENDVIRPIGEARVHFALNCMVRDCPRLPREPFLAASLEDQLQSVSVEFFNKDKHLRLDPDKKIVHVSSILDFYTEDYVSSGKARDLVPYINKFRKKPVPADYRVKFIPYDWTINQQ